MRAARWMTAMLALLLTRPAAAAGPALETEDQKTVYAVGLAISQSLEPFMLSPAEVDLVLLGIREGLAHKPQLDLNKYHSKVRELSQQRAAVVAEAEKKEAVSFLQKLGKEKGAEKTASGLIFIPVKAGSGASPKATDTVKVHYHGTLRDGSVFDSSVDRGQPATFPLNRVIPCWTEGLQKMKVGGKAKLACPSSIAYGDRGSPPKIKAGAALLFEVELLGIEAASAPASQSPGHP